MADQESLEILNHLGLSSFKAEDAKISVALKVLKNHFEMGESFKLQDVLNKMDVKQSERKWVRTLLAKLVERGYLGRPSKKKYMKVHDSLASWLAVAQGKIEKLEGPIMG